MFLKPAYKCNQANNVAARIILEEDVSTAETMKQPPQMIPLHHCLPLQEVAKEIFCFIKS